MLGAVNLDLHDYVLRKLAASKGRWGDVASGSGVARRTLEKIARQEIADPGVSHIQKLADYFSEQDREQGRAQ